MLRRLRIENLVLIREADLELGPGLNVVTGETGAGKTILAQAVGLLLGAKGDAALVGPAADEAYVEAELDLSEEFLVEDGLGSLAELRPDDEPGLVAARRVFADGRSRAYAWGRAVAREDLARVVESLIAMSGQFEQRRLGRPAHQLALLDAFAGPDQLRRRAELATAWQALQAARRRVDDLARSADDRAARVAELGLLVACGEGLERDSEDVLRSERDRLRNASALAEAASSAAELLAPEVGETDGAADLAARAGRMLGDVSGLAAELEQAAGEISDAADRLRETASDLRRLVLGLEAQPGRLEEVERRLVEIADAKRRFDVDSVAELVQRARAAETELEALAGGGDPLGAAEAELRAAEGAYESIASAIAAARRQAAPDLARAARAELASLGLGDGDVAVELVPKDPGPTGGEEARLLVRPNEGMPLTPVATTASGGELSRIALAFRAVAHAQAGEPTVVFDEIDAGVGGQTAHAVADALQRLAARAQVVTITHLPQIASAADRHLRVEKVPGDPTLTRIEPVDAAERREELERMLGGAEFLSTLR